MTTGLRRCPAIAVLLAAAAAVAAGAGSAGAAPARSTAEPTATTTTVTASRSPSAYGEPVTFTATVRSAVTSVAANGKVTITVDGTPLLSATTLTNGIATARTSTLAVGEHTVAASYAGDATTAASGGALHHVVARAGVAVTVASSANPVVYGQPVTLTALVAAAAPGAGAPSGRVAFGPDEASAVALVNGRASYTQTLPAGTLPITVRYLGDASFAEGSSPVFAQSVLPAPTRVTLATRRNPVVWPEHAVFTIVVTSASPGTGTPTGSVTLAGSGATSLTSAPVKLASGSAIAALSLTPGTTAVVASYTGSANFAPSSSNQLVQSVGKATVELRLAAPPSAPWGLPTRIAVTAACPACAAAHARNAPSGTVTLAPFDGKANATQQLSSRGTTTFTTTGAAASITYSARYSGDAYYAPAGSHPLTVAVTNAASVVSLRATPRTVRVGGAVRLTATVRGAGLEGGTVAFTDNGRALGAPVAPRGGRATKAVTPAGAGRHTFRAVFSGAAHADPGSATVSVAVRPSAPARR